MDNALPVKCPRCAAAMESGFANKSAGLSFVSYHKLDHFTFVDEDIAGAGLSKILPSKLAYFRSAVCRSCQLYLVDYSVTLDRRQAEYSADPSRFAVPESRTDQDLSKIDL